MTCKNRFSLAAIFLATACAGQGVDNHVKIVGPDTYRSKVCWSDANGNLLAFLVFARAGNLAVPYAVSAKCIEGGHHSNAVAILGTLNVVRVEDGLRVLARRFPGLDISSTLGSELPLPEAGANIYFLRSSPNTVDEGPHRRIEPIRLLELKETKVTFGALLQMTAAERQSLLEEYGSQS